MTVADHEEIPQLAADVEARGSDLVVMKFGGTSVGDVEKIKDVARRLAAARETGHRVVAVLSAMGDSTDDLIRLAHEVSPNPHPREYDMLVSVGERISNALCAMAIHDLGHEAISLTGSQAGILTDTSHGKAKIVEVRAARIHAALDDGRIVLVAGFQGVSSEHEVTTLGRGGSDATAVALAAALGGACEIFTDVEGVFTADPRLVPDARQAAEGDLRGDARDGGHRRARHDGALDRDRAQVRCPSPRAVGVQRRGGHVDRRGGPAHAREGDRVGRHPRHDRGEGDRARRPRPPGRRARACSARSRTPV